MTSLRRCVAGVVGCTAAAASLLAPTPVAAQPTDDIVRVEVRALSPVLLPDRSLRVTGLITNLGQDDLRDVQVRVYVDSRVSSRSELQDRAADVDSVARGSSTTVDAVNSRGLDDVGPRASLPLEIDIPASELRGLADRPSVHPMRIDVRGRVNRSRRASLGHVDTFLQWWPQDTAASRLAWVWPLVHTPDRRADGVFADDELAESLAPDGRLGELLEVAGDVAVAGKIPFTWAVDPALVAHVAQMARGYQVRDGEGTRDGAGEAAAEEWLTALDRALSAPSTATLALPYADPDVAALVRAGRVQVISDAFDRSRAVLTERGLRADRSLAWPPGGALGRDGLEVLTANGARAVILAEDSVEAEVVGSFTPSAQLMLGPLADDGVGLVADRTLSRILVEGPGVAGEPIAVQRFLAETAMITLERPNTSRDIVVTPPRQWAPRRAYAETLLTLSGEVPWLEAATLPDIAKREPDDISRFADYPAAAADAELPQSYLARIAHESDRVSRFRAILPAEESTLPDALDEVLLRATSASWRGSETRGARLVTSVRQRVGDQFKKVRLSTGGLITLASETGRIPITIVNELPHSVLLRVGVESRNRLVLEDPDRPAYVVNPGRSQIDIEGRAVQAGEFTVDLSLLTPDGKALPGATAQLRVRSTAYGRVALIVVIGAFTVLVVASGARLVRRRRRTAAAAAAAAG